MRYVLYKGSVYLKSFDEDCFVTGFKEKTDDTFYEYPDHSYSYARDLETGDVYDLYQVDFFIEYDGHTHIVDHKRKIENYEVEIWVEKWDFTQREIHVPITVDLHDCSKFYAHYVYFVRGGKKLDKEEWARVYMDLEEFKAEMERHCHANI